MEEKESIRKTREDFDTESEWYTYKITHPEEEDADVSSSTSETIYYKCSNPKCDYVLKSDTEIPSNIIEDIKKELKNMRCIKCGKVGFVTITKEEYEKLEKKNKSKKKDEKDDHDKLIKNANDAMDYIVDERDDLFEDLSEKLMNKEIDPKRFIALFYNCCYAIMLRASKMYKVPNFDWSHQRKLVILMGQEVLELYNIKEEQEKIISEYDISQDEIYKTYYDKYIEGDEEAFIEYKQCSRLNEYQRKLEKKYSDKYIKREEKLSLKYQERLEDKFKNNLKADIRRI